MKYLITIILINQITLSQITIPFKKVTKEKKTKNNIMKYLLTNDLQIEISLGTPIQTFPLLIKLGQFPTFILTKKCPLDIKKFDTNESSTFREFSHTTTYNFNCINPSFATETFIYGKEKVKASVLYFLIAENIKTESYLTSGEFGLSYNYYGSAIRLNLLDQLKEKKLIENKVFYLDYNNENEGNLIIGNYPHIINKKKFDVNNLYKSKIFESTSTYNWDLVFDKIYSENEIVEKDSINIHCEYEFGFIEGSNFYYKYIKNNYFDNYFNSADCFEVQLNNSNKHFYIECNKNIKIKKFPSLIFQNLQLKYNITFNYKELFYEFEDKYYFLIVFKKTLGHWKFGNVFFKKYLIYFDKDNKMFGIYNTNNSGLNISWTTIVIILLVTALIVCGILLYIFIKLYMKKRKKRANELEDNYEYIKSI